MSDHVSAPHEPQAHIDKGKRRAQEPSERTPLLAGEPPTYPILDDDDDDALDDLASSHRRGLRSQLTAVFFISLSICIFGFLFLALLAWSYASRASHLEPEEIIKHDLVFRGPDQIDVLNVTQAGSIWLDVRGRVGVDAGSAIGVGTDDDDGLFAEIWKAIGRWSVRALEVVSVNLSTITITPEYDPLAVLVTVDVPPVELPLSVDPPKDLSWLTTISRPIRLQLSPNHTLILQFLKKSWKDGTLAVRADVGQATIQGGGLHSKGWRRNFHGKMSNIHTPIHMNLPSLPGLPHPGRNTPFPPISQLLTLKSFNVSSSSKQLTLQASATIVNPAPASFQLSVPSLPFTISIPDTDKTATATALPLASVTTSPFTLTHPNITLHMSGSVLPLSQSHFPLLSHFVSRYLSGEPNTILVSSPLLPNMHAEADFPAPHPRPQVLRNVTIRDMKIIPTGTVFLASGVVEGLVVLPKGIHVGLEVFRVLPDLIIFDGEVPPAHAPSTTSSSSSSSSSSFLPVPAPPWSPSSSSHKKHDNDTDQPPQVPLPDPLPEHAFGHLRPDNWLPSISSPVVPSPGEGGEPEAEGKMYAISAKVVDVPIQVLPGRQKEFSNFVGKVIFGSEGATAGLSGYAAVTMAVEGLPLQGPGRKAGEVVLAGLPFQGNVKVGKKSLLLGIGEEDYEEEDLKTVLNGFGLSL